MDREQYWSHEWYLAQDVGREQRQGRDTGRERCYGRDVVHHDFGETLNPNVEPEFYLTDDGV